MALLTNMKPQVDATIDLLMKKDFRPDPIAGELFSRVVSVISSAYKRHGSIIEKAILNCISENERYEVWNVNQFGVQTLANTMVAAAEGDVEALADTHLPYVGDGAGDGTLQIDAVVFDNETGIVSSYEIKRGNGSFDAGKRRSMNREALATKILLKDHCVQRGYPADDSRSHVIFYYGIRSIPAPIGLTGDELDEHFAMDIVGPVEEVNTYFRSRLFEIISR
ncbi:MAG: hypothetical protein ABJH63_10235 [Rhizobiaceae bacterium]